MKNIFINYKPRILDYFRSDRVMIGEMGKTLLHTFHKRQVTQLLQISSFVVFMISLRGYLVQFVKGLQTSCQNSNKTFS